jgi:hypothetical protein
MPLRWLAVLPLICLVTARAARSQEGPPSGTLRLEIQTRQSKYHVGDSTSVRLSLHNLSGRTLTYLSYTRLATARVRLHVVDSAGRTVGPTLIPPITISSTTPPDSLPPSAQEVLVSHRGKEWVNLGDWGYDLRVPGKYSIVGTPGARRGFATSSNRVQIEMIE